MTESNVVQLYNVLDRATTLLQDELDQPYLDALGKLLEIIFYDDVSSYENVQGVDQIHKAILFFKEKELTKEDTHRAIQLALLKGMKEDIQAQHRMTPESVSLFIGYLLQKLVDHKEQLRIYNPASGTGNLLLTVLRQLTQETEAYASEIDPTLIKLSLMISNLLKQEIHYFRQDSLRPKLLDPVDVVIADLPVGYYPDDLQAKKFELAASEGHSYSHHLFIEQSVNYTKDGGYLILLIPEFLFQSDQKDQLQQYLQKHVHIIGLLQLAESTFKSEQHKKSIFILRKKGENTKDVKQPLLALLPSLKDVELMENILMKINQWFEDSKDVLK